MKKILIFGSILAVTLLILASFPSVVNAKSIELRPLVQHKQDSIKGTLDIPWFRQILDIIFAIIIGLLYWFGMLFPTP